MHSAADRTAHDVPLAPVDSAKGIEGGAMGRSRAQCVPSGRVPGDAIGDRKASSVRLRRGAIDINICIAINRGGYKENAI